MAYFFYKIIFNALIERKKLKDFTFCFKFMRNYSLIFLIFFPFILWSFAVLFLCAMCLYTLILNFVFFRFLLQFALFCRMPHIVRCAKKEKVES